MLRYLNSIYLQENCKKRIKMFTIFRFVKNVNDTEATYSKRQF